MKSDKRAILAKYLPEKSIDYIIEIQEHYKFHFKITKPRNSKLGDFKPNFGKNAIITVNGNLNKYEFLFVLLHELAHLVVWNNYKRSVKPHGLEWKKAFEFQLKVLISNKAFPENVEDAILNCIKHKKYSSLKCEQLAKAFRQYDGDTNTVYLKNIPDSSEFQLSSGKRFVKLHKIKTRYKCKEVKTGKIYTIHPLAEVINYKVV